MANVPMMLCRHAGMPTFTRSLRVFGASPDQTSAERASAYGTMAGC